MVLDNLKDKSLVIGFTYAPAGLGHLRVTDALYNGLPKEITPVLLGFDDGSISFLHRLTSVHPILRRFMEFMQRGMAEDIFTPIYRNLLRTNPGSLYKNLKNVCKQRIDLPDKLLIVATHFGLAHLLAGIKEKLEKDLGIKIILVLQVTDDSPQHIWYVPGADLTFVPSETTKKDLIDYGKANKLAAVKFEVNAYPVSPNIGKELSDKELSNRKDQLDSDKDVTINMTVPISGAAVGTGFVSDLMNELHMRCERIKFHIISKETSYTKGFLKQLAKRTFIDLHVSSHDRGVVNQYEEVYMKNVISLDVTKPSEQAFKALYNPNQRGGAVLLLSTPVGRQEYDNINFLIRHGLIPDDEDQNKLWELSEKGVPLIDSENEILIDMANDWRGIRLPDDPQKAAEFIIWAFKEKILLSMMDCKVWPRGEDKHSLELHPEGVRIFWERVEKLLM